MSRQFCRLFSFILIYVIIGSVPVIAATGPFSLSNGYYQLSGDDGLITELRFDASGQGNYDTNTIAAGGGFGIQVGGVVQSGAATSWSATSNQITFTNLPTVTNIIVALSNETMTVSVNYAGGEQVEHVWDLVYLDDGFYERETGQNYNPDQIVDMPFESFYRRDTGVMRPVEMLKRMLASSADWTMNWPSVHCRARADRDDDVILTGMTMVAFEPGATALRLLSREATAGNGAVQLTLVEKPERYSVTLADGRPLPEFYVLPQQQVTDLYDNTITRNLDDVLTEFFHQMAFWWGDYGVSGGIWAEWAMNVNCFIDAPTRDMIVSGLRGWILSDEGDDQLYAYTWGTDPGWPFPAGRDTRHFNTNANFISALARYVMWTGDTDILNEPGADRTVRIGYSSGGNEVSGGWNFPPILQPGATFGQSFTATAPFTSVAALLAVYGTSGSGATLTLYDEFGGTQIASSVLTNVPDNAYQTLSFAEQPAGTYYLELSDAVGTITWWSNTSNNYDGGTAYSNGVADEALLAKARKLMQFQLDTLLADSEDQIVTGVNIGSSDHLGRHGDVGGNYYDILPFGYHDALVDTHFYQSLQGMSDLERILDRYSPVATDYSNRAFRARQKFNQTYWREGLDRLGDARYIGCIDVNGTDHDYGYTFINTMALSAGLGEDYPERVAAVFDWLDNGESFHSPYHRAPRVSIQYEDSEVVVNPVDGIDQYPQQLVTTLEAPFFARKPFTSVASHNPTWATTDSGFTLSLIDPATNNVLASTVVTNAVDNAYNSLSFPVQKEGFYILRMSDPVGTVGWWAAQWSRDIYDRWLAMPRVSTLDNTDWWQAAVGGDPASESFAYVWDVQLQNGGGDLYESGFDVWARAQYYDADSAWQRLQWILRRYSDPDRLSGSEGFYGEGIQGGVNGAGSLGWVWSEFPETGILGVSFFRGFLGAEARPQGLVLRPKLPTGSGLTAVGARHISYYGALFDLEADADSVQVSCTSNPEGRTFYMTGGLSGSGTFSVDVPLADGEIVISPNQPVQTRAHEAWTQMD